MKRTMSSERPLGALSDSISVTNPYLYWSTSMWRTRSMVSCTAGISSSAAGSRTAGWSFSLLCDDAQNQRVLCLVVGLWVWLSLLYIYMSRSDNLNDCCVTHLTTASGHNAPN